MLIKDSLLEDPPRARARCQREFFIKNNVLGPQRQNCPPYCSQRTCETEEPVTRVIHDRAKTQKQYGSISPTRKPTQPPLVRVVFNSALLCISQSGERLDIPDVSRYPFYLSQRYEDGTDWTVDMDDAGRAMGSKQAQPIGKGVEVVEDSVDIFGLDRGSPERVPGGHRNTKYF